MSRLDDAIVVVPPVAAAVAATLSSFSWACRFMASLQQLFTRIYLILQPRLSRIPFMAYLRASPKKGNSVNCQSALELTAAFPFP